MSTPERLVPSEDEWIEPRVEENTFKVDIMPSKNPRRKRAPRGSGQRTRTGCVTCKQRRVKCDEEKPFCKKCASGGFECGGYPSVEPVQRRQSRSPSHASDVAGPSSRSMSVAPVPRIQWTTAESRSIEFAVRNLIPGLITEVESTFWGRHVLQLGHRDAAVKHALAALGAVHETRDLAFVRVDGSIPGPEEASARRFALQQYNLSIQSLGKKMHVPNPESTRAALVCCLIFVTLELLQKNNDQALKHLRSGLKIYRSRMPNDAASEVKDLIASSEDGIGEVFFKLDSQATGYYDSRRPQIVPTRIARDTHSPSPVLGNTSSPSPTTLAKAQSVPPRDEKATISFRTLRRLRAQVDDLHKQVLVYLIENQMYRYVPRRRVPADIVNYHLNLLRDLSDVGKTLESASAQMLPTSPLALFQGIQRLIVAQRALYTMARKCHVDLPDEDLDPDFGAIIDAAEPLILDPSTSESLFGTVLVLPPTFVLDATVIPALFMTAHGAPTIATRERATKLLRRARVQEGLWNSDALAEIAEKCLQDEIGRRIPAMAESLPQLSCRLGVDETGGFEPLTSTGEIT